MITASGSSEPGQDLCETRWRAPPLLRTEAHLPCQTRPRRCARARFSARADKGREVRRPVRPLVAQNILADAHSTNPATHLLCSGPPDSIQERFAGPASSVAAGTAPPSSCSPAAVTARERATASAPSRRSLTSLYRHTRVPAQHRVSPSHAQSHALTKRRNERGSASSNCSYRHHTAAGASNHNPFLNRRISLGVARPPHLCLRRPLPAYNAPSSSHCAHTHT